MNAVLFAIASRESFCLSQVAPDATGAAATKAGSQGTPSVGGSRKESVAITTRERAQISHAQR
jgi:hypothetical protein